MNLAKNKLVYVNFKTFVESKEEQKNMRKQI